MCFTSRLVEEQKCFYDNAATGCFDFDSFARDSHKVGSRFRHKLITVIEADEEYPLTNVKYYVQFEIRVDESVSQI